MNKIIERVKDYIFAVTHPTYWKQIGVYSKELDSKLKQLMSSHKFKYLNTVFVGIDDLTLWIDNHPYGLVSCEGFRPRRRTICLAYKKFQRETLNDKTAIRDRRMKKSLA